MRLTLDGLPDDERRLLFAILRSDGRAPTAVEIQGFLAERGPALADEGLSALLERALAKGIILETTVKGAGWPFGTLVDVPAFRLSTAGTDLLVVGVAEVELAWASSRPGKLSRPSALAERSPA